jgi:hypothetical protein
LINHNIVGRSLQWATLSTVLLQVDLTATAQLSQDDTLRRAFEYIEDSEYEISWAEDEGMYKAPNREQNLRFTFAADGFGVEPRDYGEGQTKPWDCKIQFEGATKGKGALVVAKPNWRVAHKHAEVTASGVSVEYQNEREGLRQNFLIKEAPDGNQPLTLTFSVKSSELGFKVAADNVTFFDDQGTDVISYSDLKVWDANGKKLEASLVALETKRFAIVVQDSDASFPIFIDPIVSNIGWTEPQSGAKFGYAVAMTGGGQNGNSSAGVIVGAPYFDTGSHVDAGKVFIYWGPNGVFSNGPSWTVEGDQTNGKIGWSVAGDGDFDGDTHFDVAIGAPYYDSANGKVWVYHGNYDGTCSSPAMFASAPALGNSAYYGNSLTFLPSIDGNASSELVVGAPGYNNGSYTGAGRVLMYFGGSTPDTTADWTASGNGSNLQFGYSVAHGENIKGGGESDLVVGAPAGSTTTGAVHVFYQSGATLGSTPTTLTAPSTGLSWGFSVAAGFDQNHDGYTDILIGAPNFSNGQTQEGKAYLFRGSSTGISTSSIWSVESNQAGAQLGFSVAGGAVSSSSYADLLIGAPTYDQTAFSLTDNGTAFYYVTDTTTLLPVLTTTINGLYSNDHNGSSVAFIHSAYLNGWIVGAPDARNSNGTLSGGTATIWKYTP